MKKILSMTFLFVITAVINIMVATHIYANTARSKTITVILQEFESLTGDDYGNQEIEYFLDSGVKDRRIVALKAFFRKHDSPLYDHADFIVKVSDEYELDFRLIPAIAMQESTACKVIPHDSYNCWGWGIYGNKITRFSSFQDGIETVAQGLKKNYIDKGLTTPEDIMAKYTPSSNGSWARGVISVLGVLE
ncbi:hypothetical protein COY15_01925 [Candidatus Roizmanbacteria bacterium CG_4_10_14_0_2_um_filter_39_12]|nr:MAG: hypothetical protein COY15_01925 [Candidatus Roizmanbacteria bacterium CG_4_10_14_0_2_um_filter_39_12]